MPRHLPAAALCGRVRLGVPIGAQDRAASTRAVYRYRVAIAGLLQLKPGRRRPRSDRPRVSSQGDGRPSPPGGRAVARPVARGLDPASLDAMALLDFFSASHRRRTSSRSLRAALKPGGALLVVDVAREGSGRTSKGIDAEDALSQAAAAGISSGEAESGIVPGHFAIRFRKP
jgi:hypothetical protein